MGGNLLECPTRLIENLRAILELILQALLADRDCWYPNRGVYTITQDGTANWGAREAVVRLKGLCR